MKSIFVLVPLMVGALSGCASVVPYEPNDLCLKSGDTRVAGDALKEITQQEAGFTLWALEPNRLSLGSPTGTADVPIQQAKIQLMSNNSLQFLRGEGLLLDARFSSSTNAQRFWDVLESYKAAQSLPKSADLAEAQAIAGLKPAAYQLVSCQGLVKPEYVRESIAKLSGGSWVEVKGEFPTTEIEQLRFLEQRKLGDLVQIQVEAADRALSGTLKSALSGKEVKRSVRTRAADLPSNTPKLLAELLNGLQESGSGLTLEATTARKRALILGDAQAKVDAVQGPSQSTMEKEAERVAAAEASTQEALKLAVGEEAMTREAQALARRLLDRKVDLLLNDVRVGLGSGANWNLRFKELATLEKEIPQERRKELEELKGAFFARAVEGCSQLFAKDPTNLKLARQVLDLLATAFPGRTAEVAPLKTTAEDKAKALITAAGKLTRSEYQKGFAYLDQAEAFLPKDQTTEMRQALDAIRTELRPVRVTDLVAQGQSGALRVQFRLKNAAGEDTMAQGRCRIIVQLKAGGQPFATLYDATSEVPVGKFKLSGKAVFYDVPQISYRDINDPVAASGFGSGEFRRTVMSERMDIEVVAVFRADGETEALSNATEVNPFSLR